MAHEPTETFLEAIAQAREELERIREIRRLAGQLAAETCCSHNYVALSPAEERFCIGCGKQLQ